MSVRHYPARPMEAEPGETPCTTIIPADPRGWDTIAVHEWELRRIEWSDRHSPNPEGLPSDDLGYRPLGARAATSPRPRLRAVRSRWPRARARARRRPRSRA